MLEIKITSIVFLLIIGTIFIAGARMLVETWRPREIPFSIELLITLFAVIGLTSFISASAMILQFTLQGITNG